MKAYLALISAAALSLAACSQEPAQQPAADTAPAAASAEASAAETAPAASEAAPAASEAAPAAVADAACSTVVESDDAMKFNVSDINISKACPQFTITLKHVGKMPKAAMGHNIVITKTEDVDAVDKEGAAEGVDKDFVKADDPRVIAATKLIGGGEETSITIDTSKFAAGNKYEFFCSFPGHIAMMRGNVNLVD
ncbi:MAG: azurin [Neisseria sp.]|nr:azurin [Neisseria sp.]